MYSYGYDGLNRLLDATFQKENDGAINDYYGEHITGSGYDKNGNIQGLERYGGVNPEDNEPIKIDDLIYGYSSTNPNQLIKVDEDPTDGNASTGFKDVTNATDYVYDANGNMVKDFNKGIGTSTTDGIIYNHLNLPLKITFANGDKIEYFYQADGVKVQKVVTQGTTVTTTDYIDGIQYTNNVLDFIPTAEGYVKNTVVNGTNTFSYVYNYTDHLGNVRLSYAKSPGNVLTILEENNYYPFGMKHQGYNNDGYSFGSVSNALALVFNGAQSYQYKYQGQERQDELGLGWDCFKWRNYDYAIGRFMSIDPLAEKYVHNGIYNFSENRVIDSRELEGLEAVPLNVKTKVYNAVKDKAHEFYVKSDLKHAVDWFSEKIDKLDKWVQSKRTAVQKVEKTSDKDLESTSTSKSGGNENPKTTGDAGDNIEIDGMVAASPTATNGNNYKDFSALLGFSNAVFDTFGEGGNAAEQVIDRINEYKAQSKVTEKAEAKKKVDSVTVLTYDQGKLVKEERKAVKDVD